MKKLGSWHTLRQTPSPDTTRSFGAPTVREGGIVFVNQKARHLIIKKRVSWMDERLKEIMRKRVNRS